MDRSTDSRDETDVDTNGFVFVMKPSSIPLPYGERVG